MAKAIDTGHIDDADDDTDDDRDAEEAGYDSEDSNPYVWRTNDGRMIPLLDMTTQHLVNTLRYLQRRAEATRRQNVATILKYLLPEGPGIEHVEHRKIKSGLYYVLVRDTCPEVEGYTYSWRKFVFWQFPYLEEEAKRRGIEWIDMSDQRHTMSIWLHSMDTYDTTSLFALAHPHLKENLMKIENARTSAVRFEALTNGDIFRFSPGQGMLPDLFEMGYEGDQHGRPQKRLISLSDGKVFEIPTTNPYVVLVHGRFVEDAPEVR